jgi:hypothetical protein
MITCVRDRPERSIRIACPRVAHAAHDHGLSQDRFLSYFSCSMRYLVKARLKPGRESALWQAIQEGTLGAGSVAGDEYLSNMEQARLSPEGIAYWMEVCFCRTPLDEERPYWEQFFEIVDVKDAHARRNCRDLNGAEPWACCHCNCTRRLEQRLRRSGRSFLMDLARRVPESAK